MNSKILYRASWLIQVLLSLILIWAVYTKLGTPGIQLAEMWPWTANYPNLVVITGVLDLMAGIGIIVPSLFKNSAKLTLYTALSVALLMISAMMFHILRGEAGEIGINIVILLLTGVVIYARYQRYFSTKEREIGAGRKD